MDVTDYLFMQRQGSDPKVKLEALVFLKSVVTDFHLVVPHLFSDHDQALEALRTLSKVRTHAPLSLNRLSGRAQALSIMEIFSSPAERRTIAEILVQAFELMVRHQVPGRVVKLLSYTANPPMQVNLSLSLSLSRSLVPMGLSFRLCAETRPITLARPSFALSLSTLRRPLPRLTSTLPV